LTRVAYNSCRNRHCPKCPGAARAEWLAARKAELLPAPYFHVVFTLPREAAEIAFQNKALVYALLMRAAAEATKRLAEKRLGARIGLLAVLHTWGQALTHHPHVHCRHIGYIRCVWRSSPAAASRSTASAGSPASQASSYP
jgi:hypothetical protein